jgi:hypothetical protein
MEMRQNFKALKRDGAKLIADGLMKIKSGKDPLSFSLYRYLALQMLQLGKKEHIYGHCFFLLSWNLMCRSGKQYSMYSSSFSILIEFLQPIQPLFALIILNGKKTLFAFTLLT